MEVLPSWNDHPGHGKLSPLTEPKKPWPVVAQWLDRVADGRDRSLIRVLDLGCGKGGTVAWLLEHGFDAYGIDVRPEYVANGLGYLGPDRLAVFNGTGYPYPDDYFDVVISSQVFEHVADLEGLAQEVARTTKPGGVGFHTFPAKWVFTEGHMQTPFIHWIPKGRARRTAIKLSLRAGFGRPYFTDHSLDERTEIFWRYSEDETFYRRPAVIRRVMESVGLSVDFKEWSRAQVADKVGHPLPWPTDRLAAWVYRNTRTMCLTTRKG